MIHIYDSKEYKKSGLAYKFECTFEYFITPNTWWLMIGYQVMYNVSLAATVQNFFNAMTATLTRNILFRRRR